MGLSKSLGDDQETPDLEDMWEPERELEAGDTPDASGAPESPIKRAPRPVWLIAPLVFLTATSFAADAFAPSLVDTYPLLLIAMSTRNRYLALVAPSVNPVAFFAVGIGRQLLSDPLWYVIGARYGERARTWVESRWVGSSETLSMWDRWFDKAAYPIIAVAPNNIVCMLAGVRKFNIVSFFAVNLGGTAVRIYLFYVFGDIFSEPIGDVVDFIGRYRWQLTAISLLAVSYQLWSGRRGPDTSE